MYVFRVYSLCSFYLASFVLLCFSCLAYGYLSSPFAFSRYAILLVCHDSLDFIMIFNTWQSLTITTIKMETETYNKYNNCN